MCVYVVHSLVDFIHNHLSTVLCAHMYEETYLHKARSITAYVQHISTLTLCPGSTHTLTHTCSECLNAYYTLSMWQRTAGKVSGNNHSVRHTQKKKTDSLAPWPVYPALSKASTSWYSGVTTGAPCISTTTSSLLFCFSLQGPANQNQPQQLEQQYSISWHGM